MGTQQPMTPTDFHVLLVLSQGALYGYAIMKALDQESAGSITPEIGSLYRVLARLVSQGYVEQVPGVSHGKDKTYPGRRRKYYELSPAGERALRAEAARLQATLDIAGSRGLLPEGGSR